MAGLMMETERMKYGNKIYGMQKTYMPEAWELGNKRKFAKRIILKVCKMYRSALYIDYIEN
jgi:hypothetical protein